MFYFLRWKPQKSKVNIHWLVVTENKKSLQVVSHGKRLEGRDAAKTAAAPVRRLEGAGEASSPAEDARCSFGKA